MDIEIFEFIGKTENKARLHFRKFCWQKKQDRRTSSIPAEEIGERICTCHNYLPHIQNKGRRSDGYSMAEEGLR